MNDPIAMLEWLVDAQQGIPTLAEMPRRTLSDKGIAGPTAAHVIEEIHTPLNRRRNAERTAVAFRGG